jgi:hypothetical protein
VAVAVTVLGLWFLGFGEEDGGLREYRWIPVPQQGKGCICGNRRVVTSIEAG